MGRNTVMTCCNNDTWRNHVISWNFTFLVTCLHGQCFIRVVTTSAMPLWFAFSMALVRSMWLSYSSMCSWPCSMSQWFFPNNLQAIVAEERCAEKEKTTQATQRSLAVFLCPLKCAANPKYVAQVWNSALRMQNVGFRGMTQLLNLACRVSHQNFSGSKWRSISFWE